MAISTRRGMITNMFGKSIQCPNSSTAEQGSACKSGVHHGTTDFFILEYRDMSLRF
jgi:hypothetical protein